MSLILSVLAVTAMVWTFKISIFRGYLGGSLGASVLETGLGLLVTKVVTRAPKISELRRCGGGGEKVGVKSETALCGVFRGRNDSMGEKCWLPLPVWEPSFTYTLHAAFQLRQARLRRARDKVRFLGAARLCDFVSWSRSLG